MFPVIDKPTRVYGNSATLIGNTFINNADNNVVIGNIFYDTKDPFSQKCIMHRTVDNSSQNKKSKA